MNTNARGPVISPSTGLCEALQVGVRKPVSGPEAIRGLSRTIQIELEIALTLATN
jgi:hypothetical protein